MPDLATAVTVTESAIIAGLPRNTLLSWRHRGHVPSPKVYTIADVFSLFTAQRLTILGIAIEPAAEIAWRIKGEWQHIVKRSSPVYLLVTRTGEKIPFEHSILTKEQLGSQFSAAAVYVNLRTVILEVQHKLSERPGNG